VKHGHWNAACVALICVVLWTGTSNSVVTTYIEDFTTTVYKNKINTTAHWDTSAGELKLFPFISTIVGDYDTDMNPKSWTPS